MAGGELRAALEQRLDALAIRTEVVEHPEVRRCAGAAGLEVRGEAAKPTVPRGDVPQKRRL